MYYLCNCSFYHDHISLNPTLVGSNNVSDSLFALAWYLLACPFVFNILGATLF